MSDYLFNRNTYGDLTIISDKKLFGNNTNTLLQQIYSVLVQLNIPLFNYKSDAQIIEDISNQIYGISYISSRYNINELNSIVSVTVNRDEIGGLYSVLIKVTLNKDNINFAFDINANDGIIPAYSTTNDYYFYKKIYNNDVILLEENQRYISVPYRVAMPVYLIPYNITSSYDSYNYNGINVGDENIKLNINYVNIILDSYSSSINIQSIMENNNLYDSDTLSFLTHDILLLDNNDNIIPKTKYTYYENTIILSSEDILSLFPIKLKIPFVNAYAVGTSIVYQYDELNPYPLDNVSNSLIELNKNVREGKYYFIHYREIPV